MDTIIHADVFFFVSTIALVLITVGLIIAIIYLIKILRNVSEVSDKVNQESGEIIADIKELRGSIKKQEFGFRYIGKILGLFFKRKHKNKSK